MLSPDETVRAACQVLVEDRDPHLQRVRDAILDLRKILSMERNPPLDAAVEAHAPAILAQIIMSGFKDDMMVVEDVAWALTNIASGTSTHTAAVVNAHGLDAFLYCASRPNEYSREVLRQVIWGMGNICGDSPSMRDMFNSAALSVILPLAANKDLMGYRDFCQNHVWCLSNCVRGKPAPDVSVCRQVLPIIVGVLEDYLGDGASKEKVQGIDEIVADALWALSYISDGTNDRITLVLETGIVPKIMSLLEGRPRLSGTIQLGSNEVDPTLSIERAHDYVQRDALLANGDCVRGVLQYVPPGAKFNDVAFLCKDWFYDVVCYDPNLFFRAKHADLQHAQIATPALRTIGNIVTGTDEQTDMVANMPGSMTFLHSLLQHPKKGIRKEAAWTLSNIAAGTPNQIDRIMSEPGLIEFMVHMMHVEEATIVDELCWVIANITSGGRPPQLFDLVRRGAIASLASQLKPDATRKRMAVCAEGVDNIFRLATSDFAERVNATVPDDKCPAPRCITAARSEHGLHCVFLPTDSEEFRASFPAQARTFTSLLDDMKSVCAAGNDDADRLEGILEHILTSEEMEEMRELSGSKEEGAEEGAEDDFEDEDENSEHDSDESNN
eukprot:PhM_4_TR2838/c0_g1_i1/m.55702